METPKPDKTWSERLLSFFNTTGMPWSAWLIFIVFIFVTIGLFVSAVMSGQQRSGKLFDLMAENWKLILGVMIGSFITKKT